MAKTTLTDEVQVPRFFETNQNEKLLEGRISSLKSEMIDWIGI